MHRRSVLNLPWIGLAALAAVVMGGAGGCRTATGFEPEPLLYADRPPIRLAVDRVEIVDESGPTRTPFERRIDVPPALATKALLQSRLTAVGGTGLARAVIAEASIERQELPTRTGLVGLFTVEPEAALTGRLDVRVEILAPDGVQAASVASGATLRRTVPEGASAAEQRRIAYELVRDLVDQLDAGLEANIRQNLARYLASSPGPA